MTTFTDLSEATADAVDAAEGKSVVTNKGADGIGDVKFESERFRNSWSLTSGVLKTAGRMRFVSPGPKFVPGRYEDSQHILVFPEQRNVLLKQPIPIDLSAPWAIPADSAPARCRTATGPPCAQFSDSVRSDRPIGAKGSPEVAGSGTDCVRATDCRVDRQRAKADGNRFAVGAPGCGLWKTAARSGTGPPTEAGGTGARQRGFE